MFIFNVQFGKIWSHSKVEHCSRFYYVNWDSTSVWQLAHDLSCTFGYVPLYVHMHAGVCECVWGMGPSTRVLVLKYF